MKLLASVASPYTRKVRVVGEYPVLARHHQKLLERPAFADTAPK